MRRRSRTRSSSRSRCSRTTTGTVSRTATSHSHDMVSAEPVAPPMPAWCHTSRCPSAMRLTMRRITSYKTFLLRARAFSLGVEACADGTSPAPVSRTADQLHFIRPAPTSASLPDTAVSFWAKRGEDRELRLYYDAQSGSGTGEEFLRFTVPAAALAQRPDGSAIAVGDSVLISVRVIDPSRLIVDFPPSGDRK